MLEFYYAKGTIALATHIAMIDAGLNYKLQRIDFASNGQQSPDYLKVNPKGRVPALITENGILTETPAILAYVAQLKPDANLAPFDDPFALAKIQEFNSYIASTLHVSHAHKMRGHRWSDDEAAHESMRKKVPETVSAGFRHLEDNYMTSEFAVGDSYSIADPYLFTIAQWMESDGVNVVEFSKVTAHREMMRARQSVQRALSEQN